MICEFCEEREATYIKSGDWHLCDDCRNRRSRFEWLVYGIGAAVLAMLAWLFVCRV